MKKVQLIVEGPLSSEHKDRRFGGRYARLLAERWRDRLDVEHGSAAHTVVAGLGDRYGWERTDPLLWEN